MSRMILSAAIAGLGLMSFAPDTGAPGGGAAVNPADTSAQSTAPATTATGAPGVRRSNKTTKYDTVEALKAAEPPKGYKRYTVTDPEGKVTFVMGRDSSASIGYVAAGQSWKVVNIDAGEGRGPGRKPSKERVIEALDNMTQAERIELLKKFGINPAISEEAKAPQTAGAVTNAPATIAAAAAPAKTGNGGKTAAASAAPKK